MQRRRFVHAGVLSAAALLAGCTGSPGSSGSAGDPPAAPATGTHITDISFEKGEVTQYGSRVERTFLQVAVSERVRQLVVTHSDGRLFRRADVPRGVTRVSLGEFDAVDDELVFRAFDESGSEVESLRNTYEVGLAVAGAEVVATEPLGPRLVVAVENVGTTPIRVSDLRVTPDLYDQSVEPADIGWRDFELGRAVEFANASFSRPLLPGESARLDADAPFGLGFLTHEALVERGVWAAASDDSCPAAGEPLVGFVHFTDSTGADNVYRLPMALAGTQDGYRYCTSSAVTGTATRVEPVEN